jgi:hypothetical protein
MSSLGELLFADGLCTQQQIEDAVQNQVILGGRMGTNLVELGVIDEETLARYLSQQHELPAMSGDNIQPDPEALKLLRPDAVDRLGIIPFLRENKRIQVLCMDPRNLKALDEVAFTTGLTPDPIVVTEIRFWQLLKQLYGIEHHLRYIALDTRDFLSSSMAGGVAKKPLEPSIKEDLVSEENFAKLYQRRDGFPEVSSQDSIPPPLPSEAMPLLTAEDLEEVDGTSPGPPGDIDRRVWKRDIPGEGRRQEDQVLQAAMAAPSFPPPEDDEEEDRPLAFEEASRLLSEATGRSAIARLVLRYARSLFKRAMLLTIHRGVALGWDALGEDVDRWSFRSVMIPLQEPSVFQLVVNSRAHFLGGLTKTAVNIEFLRAMGKKVPRSAFLLPVLVRGRVVNILYADNGHKAHSSSNIGELLILAQRISRCYESLFAKKVEAFQAQHPTGTSNQE